MKRKPVLYKWATKANAQAAIELAVFGAILLFVLGSIVRAGVNNSYSQNENFTAMRMAMLASWNGSKANTTARNNASVIFVEDRLSPDFNKYGALDRTPFIAQGSGSFSYQMLYPVDQGEISSMLPVTDVYINGLHFPLTTASFVTKTIARPAVCPDAPGSCAQKQCLRNQREWVGGTVNISQFYNVIPVTTIDANTSATIQANATSIFNELVNEGYISMIGAQGGVVNLTTLGPNFVSWLESTFPNAGQDQVDQIQSILQSSTTQYKLFYTLAVNGTSQFSPTPPGSCSGTNNALCASQVLPDINGNSFINTNGDMQYDLARTGDYATVDANFPPISTCSSPSVTPDMRCYVSWQWMASAATDASSIGLDANSNNFPSYDIDGRMKMVTIYGISQNADGSPNVTYEDFQGGDLDATWDALNSCTPQPGLQKVAQIYTFTQQGTYLQLLEGKLYNPETDQFVRSANKRDTIDLVQRIIQLSNNTGRFCNGTTPLSTVANDGGTPNPVEICVDGVSNNCFQTSTIPLTCYDLSDNRIFVRSRLEDLRGHYWFTDVAGKLGIH